MDIYLLTDGGTIIGINAYPDKETAELAARHFGCGKPEQVHMVNRECVESWLARPKED